jgi:hypothetical protein
MTFSSARRRDKGQWKFDGKAKARLSKALRITAASFSFRFMIFSAKGMTMAKKPPNAGKAWTSQNVKELKQLAQQNTPTRVIALKVGRTPAAVQAKASEVKVSLKPTNQSPYNRLKKPNP